MSRGCGSVRVLERVGQPNEKLFWNGDGDDDQLLGAPAFRFL